MGRSVRQLAATSAAIDATGGAHGSLAAARPIDRVTLHLHRRPRCAAHRRTRRKTRAQRHGSGDEREV